MNDTEADWRLQGVKYFSNYLTGVGNLDNSKPPGFCKRIPWQQEFQLSSPSHLYVILEEEQHYKE